MGISAQQPETDCKAQPNPSPVPPSGPEWRSWLRCQGDTRSQVRSPLNLQWALSVPSGLTRYTSPGKPPLASRQRLPRWV